VIELLLVVDFELGGDVHVLGALGQLGIDYLRYSWERSPFNNSARRSREISFLVAADLGSDI
jgi:hypothetical protein